MKTLREQAIEWWSNLPFNSNNTDKGKMNYTIKYYGLTRRYTDLTGREIEEIWRKETAQIIQDSVDVDSWSNDGSDPK